MDAVETRSGLPAKLGEVRGFLDSVVAELKKVTWPTRPELIRATRMVLILSLVLGLFIGLVDLILQKVLVDAVAALTR